MYPLIVRSLLWAMLAAIPLQPVIFAQVPPPPAPAEVDVAFVRFNTITGGNSTSAWWEADIELAVKPSNEGVRFVNRVRVTLNLGLDSGIGTKKKIVFYKASAEAISLEAGRTHMRFYLPPEVARRDGLQGEAKFYVVEISADGNKTPRSKQGISIATLNNSQFVDSFLAKVAAEGAANEGVLLPQHISPFAFDSSRPSPSCVRIEPTR